MKRVRFKKQYALDTNNRIAYELVSDEIEKWSEITGEGPHDYTTSEPCYNLKLLGWVPIRKLEITTDEKDIPAIDILVSVTNNK